MAWRDGARARLGAAAWAVAVVLAAVGVGAWARAGDSGPPSPIALRARVEDHGPADNPVPTTVEPTTTTTATATARAAPATTTTTETATATPADPAAPAGRRRSSATTLPVPAPAPADERAPTPEIALGTLALPSIGVTAPLGEGVTLTQIDRSPGHWPGTAMPGEVGNVVVAGHRVTHTRPFYDLDLLEPGDPLVFTMGDGTTWTYRLVRTEIVDDSALHIVDQTPAKTATLFACHPKHSAAQRIVARFALAAA